MVRQGLMAAAITFVCLLGGMLTYFYVNGMPDVFGTKSETEQTTSVKPVDQALVSGPTGGRG
jgi:hypothetical protein